MPPPLISVIIVNWNTRDLLRACLNSLPGDCEDLALETIVVDNASEDGSAEMVATEFPGVRLLRNSENLGFVRANNQGLAAARGDYLFMLNSDAELRPGCVARLLEVAASDVLIGAVGPRLLNSDGTVQVSHGPFPKAIYRVFPSRFEAAYRSRKEAEATASPDHTVAVDWLAGAALLFSRRVLERVGPLDERYHMWYDDLDWCRKLADHGYRRVLVTDAEVVHHGRQSGGQLADRRLAEQLFDSEYTYLRLHHGLAAVWLVFALRMGKALLKWLVGGKGSRADASWRLAYHRRRFVRFCLRAIQ